MFIALLLYIDIYCSQSLFTLASTACNEHGHGQLKLHLLGKNAWPVSVDRFLTRVQTKTHSLHTLPNGPFPRFTLPPYLASTTSNMVTEKNLSYSSDGLTPVVVIKRGWTLPRRSPLKAPRRTGKVSTGTQHRRIRFADSPTPISTHDFFETAH